MILFSVTFEIVTPESAEQGDYDESGFICEGSRLRDAIDDVRSTRTNQVDGVECIEMSASNIAVADWISIRNGMEFETGAWESRSLHIPNNVTTASRRRIARLIGCRI